MQAPEPGHRPDGERPPGPKRSLRTLLIYAPGGDPLAFYTGLARTYGDLVYLRMGGEHFFLVSDPRHIRDVLVTHPRRFIKGRGLDRAKRLLGNGLLTSEGATHLRQRRLIQPAFHRDRIASYAPVMTEYADRVSRSWTDGADLDVAQDMMRLTLGIVGQTLFGTDVEAHAPEVGAAMSAVMESFWTLMLPFAHVIERLPLPKLRRTRVARAELDAIIYRMIAERRRSPGDRGDLLSMLLEAQDEDSADRAHGGGMTDQQVRDEAMTIFLAGHETTANALTWTWYLLSQSPDVEARLHEEVDRVLGGRPPTVADIASLPLVERILTESMRLYPPAWIVGRRTIEPYTIDGYVIPLRSLVVFSPYIVQRDARHFADPDRFLPDRWTPELKAALPPATYLPFGGGPRRCAGESFAWMELMLVLSSLAQRWRFRLVAGHPVVPQASITLRTKYGMRMTALAR
ncbi:MAG: cytochrome P450 [Acidobacteriota bacterium]